MHLSNAFQLLELKYCERCGGLWLRLKGSTAVYCVACRHEMADQLPKRQPSLAAVRQLKAAVSGHTQAEPAPSVVGRLQ